MYHADGPGVITRVLIRGVRVIRVRVDDVTMEAEVRERNRSEDALLLEGWAQPRDAGSL